MAHELDITEGQASFVSARVDAWHQLGKTLDHSFTAEEAMAEGNLGGWNVRKVPMHIIDPVTGNPVQVPNRNAVVRDNPVVDGQVDIFDAAVRDSFHIIQNEEHAALLNALVDESGAHFETAGALNGGGRVFLSMKLPDHIHIGGVDPIETYITAINDHTGNMSFTLMVTPIRVVCANTLNAAFQEKSHITRIRHTSGAETAVRTQARKALDISFKYLDGFQQEAEQLINTTMTQSRFESIMAKEFFPGEDASAAMFDRSTQKVEDLVELFAEAGTQEGVRDTAWAGFNAMTEWFDHFSPTRGTDKETDRARRTIMDPGFKNRALELMLQG